MRKRRAAGVPISFFSFQDVLLSLIGITIVITMVLLLQVSKVATATVEAARSDATSEDPITVEERAIRDRVAALESAVHAAQARPDVDPLAKRASLRAEMRAKVSELSDLEREAKELEQQLRNLLVSSPKAPALRELMELTRIRDERLAELTQLERRKQVNFIIDEGESLRPVVFEISANRIVVSDVFDGASTRIAAGTMPAQCLDAIKLFETLTNGKPAYILMVVTPSGVALYRTLLDAIESLPAASRPRLGLDLLPEGSYISPVFPAVGGGARK